MLGSAWVLRCCYQPNIGMQWVTESWYPALWDCFQFYGGLDLQLSSLIWVLTIDEYIQSFISPFFSLFTQVVMGICIQQLCIAQMSKSGKSMGYLDIKNQAEEGSLWLNIQNTINLNLFD